MGAHSWGGHSAFALDVDSVGVWQFEGDSSVWLR